VNAGSIGAPYEVDPAAYWALLGNDLKLRRTDYDVDAALAAIAATGYPKATEDGTFLRRDPRARSGSAG
jgi:hypothetical protein